MRDEAEKRIGHLYPKIKLTKEMAKDRPDLSKYVGQELTIIAWLWARTVASPNPAVGGMHVPLVRSFWLCTKKGKEAYIEPGIDRRANSFRFVVRTGRPTDKAAVDAGTKLGRGCKFRCLLSDQPIAETHIKGAGARGELGASLLAVVAEGVRGRVYLSPESVTQIHVDRPSDLHGIDAPLADDPRNLWCLGYGLDTFDKLFTPRQLVALTTFSELVQGARAKVLEHAQRARGAKDRHDDDTGPEAYADAVATYLAFAVDKAADYWSALCSWHSSKELIRNTFGRQALPMVWDFAESNPFQGGTGGFATEWAEKSLSRWFERSIVSELRTIRNQWAHNEQFTSNDAIRALDSMERLLNAVSAADSAGEVGQMRMDLMRTMFDEQRRSEMRKRSAQPTEGKPQGGLKPWREVVTPHPDVASGRYQQAEFAADLWQVYQGEGSDEYKHPTEFFRRTFITEGLRRLLSQAVLRLSGKGGDPVVELQTNFGGGKTHSMLALYHLFSGASPADLPGTEELVKAVGIPLPRNVRRTVFVGTQISPGKPHKKPDGTTVRTLWGEIAWQLGGKEGYRLVKEDDERATNPGATMTELFNKYGPYGSGRTATCSSCPATCPSMIRSCNSS